MGPTHIEKGLAMDKSIRLALVRGELKVPAKELDPNEWLELVEEALSLCRPHAKFFGGFQLLYEIAKHDGIQTAKKFELHETRDLDARRVRCIRLTWPSKSRQLGFGAESNLLYTQEGKVLLWYREFIRAQGNMAGGFITIDNLWNLFPLEDGALKRHLDDTTGVEILERLHLFATQGYETRHKHAESMRDLRDTLGRMNTAIER